jgi:hypothetical protein
MSIATGRNSNLSTQVSSGKLAWVVQEGNDLFQGALVSGVDQLIIDKAYPLGIYSGNLFTSFTCGDDTAITTFRIELEQESYGTYGNDYFVNTTMSAGVTYQISFPFTFHAFSTDNDALILNIKAVFAGTAPTLTYNYVKMFKVV